MNGIEILASAEIVAESAFNWWAFTIMFIVMAICGAFIAIAASPYSYDRWAIFAVIVILAGGFFSTLMGAKFATPAKYETHYKVTIDDSVSMNDFLDKYEILDQEGKIFTVKEKH